MRSLCISFIIATTFWPAAVSGQGYIGYDYAPMSMIRNKLGDRFGQGNMQKVEGRGNITLSAKQDSAGRATVWSLGLSAAYATLENQGMDLLSTHGRPTVTLDEELRFLDSYLYLEKIRFDDTLHVSISEADGMRHRSTIPASIQMLVKKTLKHNTNTQRSPLKISIDITNDAITVTNNIQLRSHSETDGTGLDNLQRQYTLYNKRIEIIKTNKTFTVKIPYV